MNYSKSRTKIGVSKDTILDRRGPDNDCPVLFESRRTGQSLSGPLDSNCQVLLDSNRTFQPIISKEDRGRRNVLQIS